MNMKTYLLNLWNALRNKPELVKPSAGGGPNPTVPQ